MKVTYENWEAVELLAYLLISFPAMVVFYGDLGDRLGRWLMARIDQRLKARRK